DSIPSGGATITFNAYEFTDPRVAAGKCGIDALTLFGAGYNTPELRIPPYLCGSPRFIVVAVDGSQLTFNKGIVQVENFTDQVPSLSGNQNKVCNDPIPAGIDPQFQDVVVYQTTDPNRMRESGQVSGIDPQFVGAAGEFTNSCGSSRAAVQESSYFVVGMHIDFGAGYTLGGNAAGNYGRFVALTRYKLTLLQLSVAAAKTAGALNNTVAAKMNLLLNSAIIKVEGDPAGALEVVNKFLGLVGSATYAVTPGFNYNGEHLMRGRNVAFMLRVKVKPYAP
ncbi:MAG: hypothetical protein NT024_00740, partial [Proteobacteria bacterium]|nr:hypothetical protein [Pseudomonadota bacterium]